MRKYLPLLVVPVLCLLALALPALAIPTPGPAPAPVGVLAPTPDPATFPHQFLAPIVMALAWLLRKVPKLGGNHIGPILAALTIATFLVELGAALVVGRPDALDLNAWLPRLWEAGSILLTAAGLYGLGKKAIAG